MTEQSRQPKATRNVMRLFCGAALVQLGITLAIVSQNACFAYGADGPSRPILWVVLLLSLAFCAQMVAIGSALRLHPSWNLRFGILAVAVLLRLILLPTNPILEVDIYRYVWDGMVSEAGINPYRYAPNDVSKEDGQEQDLTRLRSLVDTHPSAAVIRSRVHYSELTTIYPPVSQIVFYSAARLTPNHFSVASHLLIMKTLIVAFDIASCVMLVGLFRLAKIHVAWTIAYAWSPLVLKEFSNSGHLDSIAVFFSIASFYCLLSWGRDCKPGQRQEHRWLFASALCLSLAIAAKIYPVLLAPLFLAYCVKKATPRLTLVWSVLLAVLTLVGIGPMFLHRVGPANHQASENAGLDAFVSRWAMNDLIFSVIQENIRPDPPEGGSQAPWYAVVPSTTRTRMTDFIGFRFGIQRSRVPFFTTRLLTLVIVFGWTIALMLRVYRDPDRIGSAIFLVLAWFWLTAPTQNPWYWTWVLPFAAFHGNRIWLLMGAVALIYYCRFWFGYHQPTFAFMGRTYRGTEVFDHIVVWMEFLPALLLIAASPWVLRERGNT